MLCDFEFDGAPKPERPEKVYEIVYYEADIALCLCHYLPKQLGYKFFFDHYFSLLELLIKLKEYKIWEVGALRKDRMRKKKEEVHLVDV